MKKLNEICGDKKILVDGLKENGVSHVNYQKYTSIDRAKQFADSGYLILSNGDSWNDPIDNKVMKRNKAYGICFSYSTSENIALWMLYGKSSGKEGALINIPNSTIKDLLNVKQIELGLIDSNGNFSNRYVLDKDNNDFQVFATDILYEEPCSNNKVKLSLNETHVTKEDDILKTAGLYYKDYGWQYEKECRIIIKLSKHWYDTATKQQLGKIRIQVSRKDLDKIVKDRIVRSPIYEGKEKIGIASKLTGKVKWNIT